MKKGTRKFVLEDSAGANCSSEVLMSYVLGPATWPSWQPEIIVSEGPTRLEKGDVVVGRARMLGFKGVEGRSVAVSVSDDIFEEEVVVGVPMRVRYEVREKGEGSVVLHRLESDLPTGIGGRFLSLLLRWRLRRLQKTALERLVAQCESARQA